MSKSPRHGMWWLMLAAGVAWLIVIAPALSILGAGQATGLLVNAASAVTIGAFFAVPALMIISIVLGAHDHCRAAQRARTFILFLVLSLLAMAGVLVASAIIVASRAGAPIADGQDDSHPRLLSPHVDARAAEIRIR